MQKNWKRVTAFALATSLICSGVVADSAQAKGKMTLNKKKVTLRVGESTLLKVKGTKKKIVWKSSKKKIAVVSKKGKVTAKKAGHAKITAKTAGKKLVCKVTVKKNTKKPQVTPAYTTDSGATAGTQQTTPVPTMDSQQTVPGSTAGAAQTTPAPSATPEVSLPPYESGTPLAPVTSWDSGVYDDTLQVTIKAQEGTEIYYTLDGTEPTTSSTKYTGAIEVKNRDGEENVLSSEANVKKMNLSSSGYDYVPTTDEVAKCTVLRAISVSPDGNSSDMITKTYFVGNDVKNKYAGAAVVSLTIDPDKLLNYDTGIYCLGRIYDEWKTTEDAKSIINQRQYWNYEGNYTQHGKDWERMATMDYFLADGESFEFSAPVGIRIHGGASRMYGQKSFNVYFREDYGQKNLKYELLPNDLDEEGKQISKYKSFMLRNGGNDTEYSKMRDVFIQNQVSDRAFAIQATKPCVVFLNGEYWGLYNLTEKYSDNNIEENFGVDKDNVVAFKEGELEEGKDEDASLYEELWSYAQKDFTDDAVYTEFCNIMDIDSFTDFYATEIYIANMDWNPEKNYQIWRTRDAEEGNSYGDCKWRYLLYDTEYSMGLYGGSNARTESFTNAIENDALFAAVMKSPVFQEKFLATLQELGTVNFDPDMANAKLDEYVALYKPLMTDFHKRFYGKDTWLMNRVEAEADTMRSFLADRYRYVMDEVESWCEEN